MSGHDGPPTAPPWPAVWADRRRTGEVPRVRSDFANGIKKLPVEVTLA